MRLNWAWMSEKNPGSVRNTPARTAIGPETLLMPAIAFLHPNPGAA
jgi:hypothetical protein